MFVWRSQMMVDSATAAAEHELALTAARDNAATMKAAYDKSVCDAAEERAAAAAHLATAQNNAATMKAAHDKSVCDAAEERAAAAAVMAQSKAEFDSLTARLDKVLPNCLFLILFALQHVLYPQKFGTVHALAPVTSLGVKQMRQSCGCCLYVMCE
jgi:hypothetical protein